MKLNDTVHVPLFDESSDEGLYRGTYIRRTIGPSPSLVELIHWAIREWGRGAGPAVEWLLNHADELDDADDATVAWFRLQMTFAARTGLPPCATQDGPSGAETKSVSSPRRGRRT